MMNQLDSWLNHLILSIFRKTLTTTRTTDSLIISWSTTRDWETWSEGLKTTETWQHFLQHLCQIKLYYKEDYTCSLYPSYSKLHGCSCQHKLSSCIRPAAPFSHMSDNLIHVTINIAVGTHRYIPGVPIIISW